MTRTKYQFFFSLYFSSRDFNVYSGKYSFYIILRRSTEKFKIDYTIKYLKLEVDAHIKVTFK